MTFLISAKQVFTSTKLFAIVYFLNLGLSITSYLTNNGMICMYLYLFKKNFCRSNNGSFKDESPIF